ncbi:MAG: phosphoribosylanthranilate isomerase [Methanothrix sp.]|nr:phosphoribosylanthranilate isomerase [Methanothrix sp.]
MTRVKICGLTDRRDLKYALAAGADALGFVVEIERSRHCITTEKARALIEQIPVFVNSVAVVSPMDLDDAVRLSRETNADILQIHGTLGPDEVCALRRMVPQRIIAAAAPVSKEARLFEGAADAVLLDTFKDGMLGGSGEIHNWDVSAALAKSLQVPVILAGGLNPSNVQEAILRVRPHAVDVSSGVETDGRKDPSKMRAFVDQVRSCP